MLSPGRDGKRKVGLKHKGHRILETERRQLSLTLRKERVGIRTVRRHAAVQRSTSRKEAFGFGLVESFDHAHVLAHAVAMIVGRTEGLFGNDPARWEDDKVTRCDSRRGSRVGENREDGRILLRETSR